MEQRIIDTIKECLAKNKKITFLVGAGISAESGIPTFRGKDGYWVSGSKNYKAQEIATLRMFKLASMEVWKWFLYRKSVTQNAKPNAGHYSLKHIEDLLQSNFVLISQNVDSMHRKVGNSEERTFLIHGDFDYIRCGDECSKELYPFPKNMSLVNRNKDIITEEEWALLRCPKCGEDLRPHVLWFDETYNEIYYKKETVLKLSQETGILFIIGTSGATNLPQIIVDTVLSVNAFVVEINLEESYFTELLLNNDNALTLRRGSSGFLQELKNELEGIMKYIRTPLSN